MAKANIDDESNIRKRSYRFALDVVSFCKELPNKRIYWTIVDQLVRSAMSVGANVFEAIAASSRKDFINFYRIALKSANETLFWLMTLEDSRLEDVDVERIKLLIDEAKQLCKMLGKSIVTLQKKQ